MNELDDLLKSLRAEKPRAAEVARWKAAVMRVRERKATRWIELAAAVAVGIVIGSTLFNKPSSEENFVPGATIERVVTKIE